MSYSYLNPSAMSEEALAAHLKNLAETSKHRLEQVLAAIERKDREFVQVHAEDWIGTSLAVTKTLSELHERAEIARL